MFIMELLKDKPFKTQNTYRLHVLTYLLPILPLISSGGLEAEKGSRQDFLYKRSLCQSKTAVIKGRGSATETGRSSGSFSIDKRALFTSKYYASTDLIR
jgi:hypothetical protein